MHNFETEKWKKIKCEKFWKKWKMNKAKEEKGFMHREVMQVTPLGYWPGSLAAEPCLCSCVTLLGYCPSMLALEKHQRWKLKYDYHISCVPIHPSSRSKQLCLLGLECVLTNQDHGRCYIFQSSYCGSVTQYFVMPTALPCDISWTAQKMIIIQYTHPCI